MHVCNFKFLVRFRGVLAIERTVERDFYMQQNVHKMLLNGKCTTTLADRQQV